MNLNDLRTLALQYADRQDNEVVNNMTGFIMIVEAKINRRLTVGQQTVRTQLLTNISSEYYGLPPDFSAMRDLELQTIEGNTIGTVRPVAPEVMNNYKATGRTDMVYSIIAQQLQIQPKQDSKILELLYYRNLPHLADVTDTNWLSELAPDCYIFGLVTEISAFVKDATAAAMWAARFEEVLTELETDDKSSRWSGPSMQTRIL